MTDSRLSHTRSPAAHYKHQHGSEMIAATATEVQHIDARYTASVQSSAGELTVQHLLNKSSENRPRNNIWVWRDEAQREGCRYGWVERK
jgi:hypothetical protein